jgi:hypothetical protein
MAKNRPFLTLQRPIQTTVYRAEAQLFPHFRSSEAAVTCDPNGRPLTTELQAVSGFPPLSQLLVLAAGPPAPLPSDPSSQYRIEIDFCQ